MRLLPDHRLMPWLVRHIGWCLTRFQLKGHGKTAFHVIRGKPYDGHVEKFGTVCMFKIADKAEHKLEDRWLEAIYVGKLEKTDEHLGLTPDGTIKARSVQPRPKDKEYSLEFLAKCRGAP